MKKNSKTLTIAILVTAVALLLAGTVTGARAALVESETYKSQIETKMVALALNENGKEVAYDKAGEHSYGEDALLKDLLGSDGTMKIGKDYDEVLTVTNTGEIDQYVRVTIYRYWTGEEAKRTDLKPDLIRLGLNEKDWIVADKSGASPEQVVLYYKKPLAAGETSPAVMETIGLDPDVALYIDQQKQTTSDSDGTVTTTYTYHLVDFGIDVVVDGVQTHNAKDAIKSAWGVDVNVAGNGQLSL